MSLEGPTTPQFDNVIDPDPEFVNAYTILQGYPKESWSVDGGFRATVRIKVPWDDRITIAQNLLPRAYLSGGEWILKRAVRYPWYTPAVCTSVKMEPPSRAAVEVKQPGQTYRQIEYASAMLLCEFETASYDSEQIRWPESELMVNEQINVSGEFNTLPTEKLYWVAPTGEPGQPDYDPGVPVKQVEAPGQLIRMLDWQITWKQMFSIPYDMLDWHATVNSVAHYSPKYNLVFEPETLLWGEPTVKPIFTADGRLAYEVSANLQFRYGTWNLFFRPGESEPSPIYDDANEQWHLYTPTDWSNRIWYST